MAKAREPSTPALRALDQAGVKYSLHEYRFQARGGTAHAAAELGLDEHQVIKTLVMRDSRGKGLIVLMHGDRQVSTKALARQLEVKSITPVDPPEALRLTGYQVGGISPLGTKSPLPVYMQASVLALERIYLNAGRRGLLAGLAPDDLKRLLELTPVEAEQE